MKKFDVVLFDLDGTLTDSADGIVNSVAYALEKWGIRDYDRDELVAFVGPPLYDSFAKYCNVSDEDAHKLVTLYREYYTVKGINENIVYDGIPALLAELHGAGKTILLATSKPEIFARQILKVFNLDQYFTFIGGADLEGKRVAKADVVAYTLKSAGISDQSAVLVGDREYDVLGAQANGIASIAVTYGYGSPVELAAVAPDFTVDTVVEIAEILLKN